MVILRLAAAQSRLLSIDDSLYPQHRIQTMPGRGFNAILRLYSPLEPFFTKAWRPSEIEEVATTTGPR